MIDSPRITTVAGARAALAAPAPATSSGPAASGREPVRPIADVSRTVDTLAAEPPVDGDRVTAIRTAIANGSYPLHPTKIADALIAARWLLIDGDPA